LSKKDPCWQLLRAACCTLDYAVCMHLAPHAVRVLALGWLVVALTAAPGLAQRGDKAGEAQPDVPVDLQLPPPPVLSPAKAQQAFSLAPGWRIDLVAAEPLIEAPVQALFDADGRLWVVEMRGYMPNIDGLGETEPNGRVSVLFDDDGDGRMDRAVRFLDGLVLPRSIALVGDGVLVIAPPHVLYCRDTDGDFQADERTIVDSGIDGIVSPEYGPNGLLRVRDGVHLCVNHDRAYQWSGGKWSVVRRVGGGQYGITRTESGQVLYNTNSDLLRGDRVDALALARHPFLDHGPLVNAGLVATQAVHPVHVTPGVNRAYRDGWLKDGRLQRADAACSPHVARGDAIPTESVGDVFVCEPAGNLVVQLQLEPEARGGFGLQAQRVHPNREVLASTDERFRPVGLCDGPDGALYIVDMHRGVLQHKNFVTSFLRKQVVERKLEQPLNTGRIWRMSADKSGGRMSPAPLSALRAAQLVALLESTNGWTRDTARRLLADDDFERAPLVDALRAAARAESALVRRQAVEVLDELDAVGETLLVEGLADRDVEVRMAVVHAWRKPLERNEAPPLMHLLQHLRAPQARLAWEAWATVSGRLDTPAVVGPLLRDASDAEVRRVAMSGYAGRSVEFFEACVRSLLMKDHSTWDATQGRADTVREIARLAAREARTSDLSRLVDIYVARLDLAQWVRFAMMDGLLDVAGKRPLMLEAEPKRFLQHLASVEDPLERAKAEELWASIMWPGRTDLEGVPVPRALTAAETALVAQGRQVYATICAACHQSSGRGEAGKAPALRDSPRVLGDARVAARIVLGGLDGSIGMPAWNGSDADIAAVLSYVRREWGHGADPVGLEAVAQARVDSAARTKPWTMSEVVVLPPAVRTSGESLVSKGLDTFRSFGDARYTLDGMDLVGSVTGGKQSFLATQASYGDFVLEVDVRLEVASNSGIQVRSHEVDGRVRGPQIEIDPGDRAWSGGLYDEGRRGWLASLEGRDAARGAFKKNGWNLYRIEVRGPRYRVQVNGVETCDALDPLDLEGFLAFQVHSGKSGEVHWRDPRVIDLGVREWRAADLSRPLEFGGAEEVLRLRFAGKGARLVARCADPAAMTGALEIASGVHASAAGLVVDFDLVPVPPKQDEKEHEWHLTIVGERVALHKDGARLVDAFVPGLPAAGMLSFVPGNAKLLASHRMAMR